MQEVSLCGYDRNFISDINNTQYGLSDHGATGSVLESEGWGDRFFAGLV